MKTKTAIKELENIYDYYCINDDKLEEYEQKRKIKSLRKAIKILKQKKCKHEMAREETEYDCYPYGDTIKYKICSKCGKQYDTEFIKNDKAK